MGQFEPAQAYFRTHPGALEEIGLSNAQTQQILNYIDGDRSILTIRNRVAAWTGEDLSVTQVARYLELLEEIGWVELDGIVENPWVWRSREGPSWGAPTSGS